MCEFILLIPMENPVQYNCKKDKSGYMTIFGHAKVLYNSSSGMYKASICLQFLLSNLAIVLDDELAYLCCKVLYWLR